MTVVSAKFCLKLKSSMRVDLSKNVGLVVHLGLDVIHVILERKVRLHRQLLSHKVDRIHVHLPPPTMPQLLFYFNFYLIRFISFDFA